MRFGSTRIQKEVIDRIASKLGISEREAQEVVELIANAVKPEVGKFVGRRSFLAGLAGVGTALAISPAMARTTITDEYVDIDGVKLALKDYADMFTSPAFASAVVEKPEYDPDHVYAWKPANNYKGWKLIARGEAGVDDAEIINNVLDNIGDKGKLVIASDVTLNETVVVKHDRVTIEALGTVYVNGDINGFQIGTDTDESLEGYLILNRLEGSGKGQGTGILYKQCHYWHTFFTVITKFDTAILIDGVGTGASANWIHGGRIANSTYGIKWSTSDALMQGWVIHANIVGCNYGIYVPSNPHAGINTFIGVIDNADVSGSYDIWDELGNNTYILDFIRDIGTYSYLPNGANIVGYGYAPAGIVTFDQKKGLRAIPQQGALKLFRDDGIPFLEFGLDNRISEWKARIMLKTDYGLDFIVNEDVTALTLEPDGHVNATNYGIKTKYFVDDYGGNFANFTPPAGEDGLIIIAIDTNSTNPGKRLYVYANGEWHYVDLT